VSGVIAAEVWQTPAADVSYLLVKFSYMLYYHFFT
jgi:hypothetical protein